VMFGRQPIAESCGGLKALGVTGDCEICGGNPALCDSVSDEGLAYDPARKHAPRH
jgi:hypothetical protein